MCQRDVVRPTIVLGPVQMKQRRELIVLGRLMWAENLGALLLKLLLGTFALIVEI